MAGRAWILALPLVLGPAPASGHDAFPPGQLEAAFAEIARLQGIPLETVRARLRRGTTFGNCCRRQTTDGCSGSASSGAIHAALPASTSA